MATTTTKPDVEVTTAFTAAGVPEWPRENGSSAAHHSNEGAAKPSPRDALQALLAFSSLHDQVRRRKTLAARNHGFDAAIPAAVEFDPHELFVLDEVLQLVAERALAITGADGLAI